MEQIRDVYNLGDMETVNRYIKKLASILSDTGREDLIKIYYKHKNEFLVLLKVAKSLPHNNRNRRQIVKLFMEDWHDNMLMIDKRLKKLFDEQYDLDSEEVEKELKKYDVYKSREDVATQGETSYRKRSETLKLQINSEMTGRKIVNNLNLVGQKTNNVRKKVVNNINSLRYK